MKQQAFCLLLLITLGLSSCSAPPKPEALSEEVGDSVDLTDSEFDEEGEFEDELDEEDGEVETSATDEEFEDPELTIAANDDAAEEEFDIEEEFNLDEEDLDIADSLDGASGEEAGDSGFEDFDLGGESEESGSLAVNDDIDQDENTSETDFSGVLDDDFDSGDVDFDTDLSDQSVVETQPIDPIETSEPEEFAAGDTGVVFEEEPEPSTEFSEFDAVGSGQESSASEVLSIDYNSIRKGGSFVIKSSTEVDYRSEYIPETRQFVIELKGVGISRNLQRPFLTKDFQQSFGALNAYQESDGDTKIVIQVKDKKIPSVGFEEKTIFVEPGVYTAAEKKVRKSSKGTVVSSGSTGDFAGAADPLSSTTLEDYLLENSSYFGQPISIQAKEEDIVNIIHFISEEVGANIVVSSSVKGTISIKLKNVPWDQALITIMKTQGLGYVRSGNVLRIATLDELQKESDAATAVQNARKSLAPFHVKVFPLSYADPTIIESKLKPFLSAATQGGTGREGQIISEQRSSSVIVNDTLEVIKDISILIQELDRPPLQVMIEGKVVEATKTFSRNIQSLFNFNASSSSGSGGNQTATNNGIWNNNFDQTFYSNTLTFSGLNFLNSLTNTLRLGEIEEKVKVLSAPRVIAMNNEKAEMIQVNQVLARQVITDPGGQTTVSANPIDVELRLEVTPQVTADNNVIMELLFRRAFPGAEDLALDSTPINTREAKTKVIIGNNRTAVIGGIYQSDSTKRSAGIPGLRNVPILKWLLGDHTYRKIDSELILFVTPRILNRDGKLSVKNVEPVVDKEFDVSSAE